MVSISEFDSEDVGRDDKCSDDFVSESRHSSSLISMPTVASAFESSPDSNHVDSSLSVKHPSVQRRNRVRIPVSTENDL